MPTSSGPNTLGESNLVFAIDAADAKNSMLPFSTFLNMSSWGLGSGGTGPYSQNGGTDENQRVNGTDPWGNSAIVWESRPNGNGNDDGGWGTGFYDVDQYSTYRWSVWVKRTSTTSGGTMYLGLYGTPNAVVRLDNGTQEGNPYWECNGTSVYTKDVWYLLVGHCFPSNYSGGLTRHPDTGRYIVSGRNGDLNFCNIGGDVKWYPGTTGGYHRVYHYYCNDSTTRLQWIDPRLDKVDGTEPKISDLLKASPANTRSIVGGGIGKLSNGAVYSKDNGGCFVFDGTNDYISIGSGTGINQFSGDFTISLWAMRTAGGAYGNLIGDYYTNSTVTTGEWQIMMGPSSELNFYKVGPGYIIGGTSSGFSNNTWINVVVTRSGNLVTMYANSNAIATGTDSTSYGTVTGNLNIGIDGNNSSEPLPGKISKIELYNRALTAQEVRQNYQQYKTRFNLS
jgi:hypothetical protein